MFLLHNEEVSHISAKHPFVNIQGTALIWRFAADLALPLQSTNFTMVGIMGSSCDYPGSSSGSDLRRTLRRFGLGDNGMVGFDLLREHLLIHVKIWKQPIIRSYTEKTGLKWKSKHKPASHNTHDGQQQVQLKCPTRSTEKGPNVCATNKSREPRSNQIDDNKQTSRSDSPERILPAQNTAELPEMSSPSLPPDAPSRGPSPVQPTLIKPSIQAISLLRLVAFLLMARQQGRNTNYGELWTIHAITDTSNSRGYDFYEVSFSGHIIEGMRMVEFTEELPGKERREHCVFGCQRGGKHRWMHNSEYF